LVSEAKKLNQFFEVAELLDEEHIPDHKLKFLSNFIKNLPAFVGKFDHINR
jgi:hypothetical protein